MGTPEMVSSALHSLKVHKMRTFLASLGVIVGVMTVLAMISLVEGVNKEVLGVLRQVGSDTFILSKWPIASTSSEEYRKIMRRKDFEEDDAEALVELCPAVLAAVVQREKNFNVKVSGEVLKNSRVAGVGIDYLQIGDVEISDGRFFSFIEEQRKQQVAVVGTDVVENLFPNGRVLGKQIRFGGKTFRIIGVWKTRGKMFGQSMDNFVVIPFRTFDKLFSSDRFTYTSIVVRARSQSALPEAMNQATFLLRARRGVKAEEENDFEIFTQDTLVEVYKNLTGAVFIVMIGIASIALLVGGIGIMNVMLATVSERTREIGIRKAIGARRSHIIKQFLTESIMLTGGGGLVGLALGFGIAKLVSSATPLPSSVPFWAVALGLGICVSVGLFFGILPAFRAARLDPVEALRYE